MADLKSGVAGYSWRRILSSAFALVPIVLWLALFELWRNQLLLVTSWFGGFGLLEPVFYEVPHRLHEFAAQLIWWPIMLGLVAHLYAPRRWPAGILVALWGILSVLIAIAVTGSFALLPIIGFVGVPILLATLLHPSGRGLVAELTEAGPNKLLLGLVVLAAIPLLAFGAQQVGLQTGAIEAAHGHAGAGHDAEVHEAHVKYHHFMFVTGWIVGVLGLGLLASLQPAGWRLAAWIGGAMVGVYALGAILAPAAASNPGLLWNLAAVVWAVVFVGAAEMERGLGDSTAYGSGAAG